MRDAHLFNSDAGVDIGEGESRDGGSGLTLMDLAGDARWCAWQIEQRPDELKPRKIGYGVGQRRLRSNDPQTWLTYGRAAGMARVLPSGFRVREGGVGVVTGDLGEGRGVLAGLDLDSCVSGAGLAGWAETVLESLGEGGYAELSPSGTGIKAFVLIPAGEVEAVRAAWAIDQGAFGRKIVLKGRDGSAGGSGHAPGVEFYCGLRWFAVTGGVETLGSVPLGEMTGDVARRVVEAMRGLGMDVKRVPGRGQKGVGNSDTLLTPDEMAALDGEDVSEADLAVWKRLAGTEGSRLSDRLEYLASDPDPDRSGTALAMAIALRGAGVGRDGVFRLLRMHGVNGWFDQHYPSDAGRQLMRMWNSTQQVVRSGLGAVDLPKIEEMGTKIEGRVSDMSGGSGITSGDAGIVALRYDAATVRRLIEGASAGEVVRLFLGLVETATLDAIELEEMCAGVAKKARVPKSAIKDELKEIKKRQRQRRGGSPNSDWQSQIQRNENGDAYGNLANAVTFLREAPELKGIVSHDLMMRSTYLNRRVPDSKLGLTGETQQDNDISEIQEWLQRQGLTTINRDIVQQSINLVAMEHAFHPVQDYLTSLRWDGVPRLNTWLRVYLGAISQSPEYLAGVGRYFILSMAYRIMKPGCQCDYMIVLEGPQGIMKTTACNVLAGNWFSNSMPDLHGNDDVRLSMHLRGKWLIEVGELASFKKSEMDKLKNFLTRREETYTPKFARNEVVEPRQCVFIGTTNEYNYLKDSTGARRQWPVRAGDIQIDLLKADRDQLFAEAMSGYRNGEQYWPSREFEALHIKPEQQSRFVVDAWEDTVAEWLECPAIDFGGMGESRRKPPVTVCSTKEIAAGALRLEVTRQDQVTQKRIVDIMTKLGWKIDRHTRRWSR